MAAAIRLPTLALQSYWLDEGYTVRLVRMSFGGMLSSIPRTESTPPVYYAVAWVWSRAFGSGEFGLRSLSALAGVATVAVAYRTARRLGGPRAAIIAGLLLAVSPLMVWFSQEARAYALAALLSALTLLCLVGWLQDRRHRWLAGWALTAALGLATHYFVAFVVVCELVVLWWHSRWRWRRALVLATCAVLVVGAALVPLALAQRGTGHADYIAQGSLGHRILQVPKQLLIGYASPGQLATGVVAAVIVVLGVLWPLARSPAARRRAAVPLGIGVLSVVAPIVLALAGIDFLDTRNLLPALPVLWTAGAIAFATPADRLPGRVLATGLAAVLLVIVVLVDSNPVYQRDDWRGASRALGPVTAARAIVVSPGSGVIPLQAYLPRLRVLAGAADVREIAVVAIPAQSAGAGIGIPPRPTAPLPVPPGFRLVRTAQTRTYTVLVYRSAVAAPVSPSGLAPVHLGDTGEVAVLQTPAVPRLHR